MNDISSAAASSGLGSGSGSVKEKQQAYDNIKVVVRSRPLNSDEKRANTASLVACDQDTNSVSVNMRGAAKKRFSYDMVFGQYSTQSEVYERAISPVVDEVLLGYNCTVFAYGQTGTGKTHTMEGVIDDPNLRGMIPRAVSTIFEALEKMESAEHTVKVSFLELYNEELQDLLSMTDDVKLRILDDKSRMSSGVSCHNLEQVMVTSPEDILSIMRGAMAKRQVGETKLNKASSRSHCIFTLTLHIKETTSEGEDLLKVGKLNLVDLAGSECIGRSGAKNARAREAGNINKSLLTLGRVISALVEKTPHIPYRDSKLTRLLQESLGGRCKTCIIATVAPSVQCLDETLSTLEYASRAKSIKNKPEANQRLTKRAMIKEYAEDLERLRQELASARAKDGVFMDEDRYNDMLMQLDSQKTQIEELEDLVEVKSKEMAELEEKYEEVCELLDQCREDLKNTQNQLGKTKQELDETKVELDKQVTIVEETRVLVRSHQETETALRDGTKMLQGTLSEAKSDNSELHAKIGRKAAVEESNKAKTVTYSESTQAALVAAGGQSTAFVATQLESNAAAQASLDAFATGHAKRSQAALEAVRKLEANAKSGVSSITDSSAVAVKTASLKQWEALAKQTEQQRVDAVAATDEAEAAAMAPITNLLVKVLVAQDKALEEHTQNMNAKLNAAREDAERFAKTHALALKDVTDKIGNDAEESRRALQATQEKLAAFVEAENARVEEASQALATQIGSMLTAFTADAKANLATAAEEAGKTCEESVQAVLCSEKETKAAVAACVTTTGEWCAANMRAADEALEALAAGREAVTAQTANAKTEASNASDAVKTHASAAVKRSNAAGEATLALGTAAAEEATDLFVKLEAEARGVEATASADADAAAADVEAQETTTKEWVTGVQTKETANAAKVTAFGADMTAKVNDMTEVCKRYADEEITSDVPTNKTPKRKAYKFVREIPRTKLHDKILAQYRERKANGELTEAEINANGKQEEQNKDHTSRPCTPVPVVDTDECGVQEQQENKDENMAMVTPAKPVKESQRQSLGDVSNQVINADDTTEPPSSMMKAFDEVSQCPSTASEDITTTEDSELVNEDCASSTRRLSESLVRELTVNGLRTELKSRMLSQLGNKHTLQERLVEAIALEHTMSR